MEKAQRLNSRGFGSVNEFVYQGRLCGSKRGNTAEEQRVIQFSRKSYKLILYLIVFYKQCFNSDIFVQIMNVYVNPGLL